MKACPRTSTAPRPLSVGNGLTRDNILKFNARHSDAKSKTPPLKKHTTLRSPRSKTPPRPASAYSDSSPTRKHSRRLDDVLKLLVNANKVGESGDDPLRLKGGTPYESCPPMSACEELLNRFDAVLSTYKNALEAEGAQRRGGAADDGPCGTSTCKSTNQLSASGRPTTSGRDKTCDLPVCPFPVGAIPSGSPWTSGPAGGTAAAFRPIGDDGTCDDRTCDPRVITCGDPTCYGSSGMQKRMVCPRQKIKGGKKKKRRSPYVYCTGNYYPGVTLGHKECIIPGRLVPPKMGWLWNAYSPGPLKPRKWWRPGAVGAVIARKIEENRRKKGMRMMESVRAPNPFLDSSSDESVSPKPTLHIKKRDGVYLIQMNPLKDPKTLAENENPYMDCTPMFFKISKRDDNKNKMLEDSCGCDDTNDGEESSDSELDIEFTPPAGIINPELMKKRKNLAHTDTQYLVQDFNPKGKATPAKGGKGGGGKGKGKGKKGKK